MSGTPESLNHGLSHGLSQDSNQGLNQDGYANTNGNGNANANANSATHNPNESSKVGSQLDSLLNPEESKNSHDSNDSVNGTATTTTTTTTMTPTPEDYALASNPAYVNEKKKYLGIVSKRIQAVVASQSLSDRVHLEVSHVKLANKYRDREDLFRRSAYKELRPVATAAIDKFDGVVQRENKKLANKIAAERRRIKRAEKKAELLVQQGDLEAAAAVVAAASATTARITISTGWDDDLLDENDSAAEGDVSMSINDGDNAATNGNGEHIKNEKRKQKDKNGDSSNSSNNGGDKKEPGTATGTRRRSRRAGPGTGSRKRKAPGSSAEPGAAETLSGDTTEEPLHPLKIRIVALDGSSGNGAGDGPAAASDDTDASKKKPSQKEVRAIARLYQNTYETIWKEMARRDASKTFKLMQNTSNIRMVNMKKTAILSSKEARKWQFRTNKTNKDLQAKARRGMREMLSFWRRNEREERDLRKKAEKEALDRAKKEEEERESRRQARKLNFLITQTELYSHFIGRKIQTDEAEGRTPSAPVHDVDESAVDLNHAKEASMLDFDQADDDDLHKAAMANAQTAVLEAKAKAQSFNKAATSTADMDIDGDDMNFQNPTSLGNLEIPQPKMLRCQLKEYQLKGLNWLANLYEQGINGILADEMGLGKTVQSISVMAYLAETHNIWGPFLVIAPASTLHNWQQEISKFIPDFTALPYWGSGKDRKVLRKFWDRKQVTYTKDSPFHVLITSYQLVVADAQYLQRIKWQYMILDEAQAIKSSSSTRWKSLLSFQCRNRLLLTGTPIQNSMQELWALLHFIMPSLFDSHEEFSEWFSKDIESHATTNTKLNEQQLRRLHMILKPFMLRRVKKNVQQELGDKIEIDLYCELTNRQRLLYKMLKSQISVMDIIERAASGSEEGTRSLMNLVMQFRKVCNHPDLFERADVKSAFSFATFADTASILRDPAVNDLYYSAQNQIKYILPKLVYKQGGVLNAYNEYTQAGFYDKHIKNGGLSIWDKSWISNNSSGSSAFSWLPFSGYSADDVNNACKTDFLLRSANVAKTTPRARGFYERFYGNSNDLEYKGHERLFLINEPLANKFSSESSDELLHVIQTTKVNDYNKVRNNGFSPRVLAPPILLQVSNATAMKDQHRILFNTQVRSILHPMSLNQEWSLLQKYVKPVEFPPSNLYPKHANPKLGYTNIEMPSMAKFITESGKLKKLDELLVELKANDHRVLIYFQMTKMIDLMEEYLTYRQYKYCRLDGSSKLSERRDLVNDWQTKPELFVFLLSTRAGGLGINLTAADTVVFYDSDWNPTIDSQAMDRAHRLGQTRQVTVYRLLVKGTIEERMRDRAKQKEQVQNVVMEGEGGAATHTDTGGFQKPGRDVAYWLLDDDAAEKLTQKNSSAPPVKEIDIEEMYHENEGNFDDSNMGTSTTVSRIATPKPGVK